MELNKYLRIKQADKYIQTKPLPTSQDWLSQVGDDVASDKLARIDKIVNSLADNAGLAIPRNDRASYKLDTEWGFGGGTSIPFFSDPYSIVLGVPSLSGLLHENGHQYMYHTDPQSAVKAMFASNARSYHAGDKFGKDILDNEARATNWATQLAYSIKDTNLRNRLLYHLNGILTPAYRSYSTTIQPYVYSRNIGKKYGSRIGLGGGIGIGGLGGYYLGKAIGDKYLTKNWQKQLAGIAGGLIGATALGAAGYYGGKSLGGRIGQHMANKYVNSEKFKNRLDQLNRISTKAHLRELNDKTLIPDLEKYLNLNN